MGRVTRSASSLSQQSRSSEVDENSQDSTSSLTEVLTCNSKSIQPDLSYHRKFVIAKGIIFVGPERTVKLTGCPVFHGVSTKSQ